MRKAGSQSEPLSYAECVRRVIRAAKAPVPFRELVDAVARMRPLTSRRPEQSIRGALSLTPQIVHTGEGYWYLPYLLKGNVFRIPLTPETLRSGTLVLTEEALCALWPSFFEGETLRDERPPRIQLEGGTVFKEPIAHIRESLWGWQAPRVLRDWLHRRRARKSDALILVVRDGQARRYAMRVEPRSDRDEKRIAERNRILLEAAARLWRKTPDGPVDYAARLVARGVFRDPCPPDPLAPMMEHDSRFAHGKPAGLSAAEGRALAEDWLEDGLEWLEQGNGSEAAKSFWKSVVVDPTFADGYNHLGNLAFERGDWPGAAGLYQRAFEEASKEFDPNDRRLGWWGRIETRPLMRALHGIGLCQWRQRKFRQAIRTFERMLAMNPNDNQGVRYLIGGLYHELGQRKQATQWYRQTADDPHVLFNWALLCIETRQRVDAVTHLLQGIAANPYIAPRLLGRIPPRYSFWHATNLEEPETAADYDEYYRHLWKRKEALEFLRAVWANPSTQDYLARVIELRQRLTDERNFDKRGVLIHEESRLTSAPGIRPIAEAIAHDFGRRPKQERKGKNTPRSYASHLKLKRRSGQPKLAGGNKR